MRKVVLASRVVISIVLGLASQAWAAPCSDGVVGDPNAPPSIQIGALPPGGVSGTVTGTVNSVRRGSVRVSVWAHTDRYYPQPLLTAPFACVASDGSWSSFTNPWERVIALLVDDSYAIPAGPSPLPSSIDYHPSTDPGVLAWTEMPPSRTLSFGGETWWVKDSAPFSTGPGPCVFSPGGENVFVDGDGRLHLKVVRQGNTWTCSEAVLDRARGHGIYTFQVLTTLDKLDAREVFSGFLFESLTREMDIECSPALTGLPNGCQYVVQPFGTPGNRRIFSMPSGPSTHRIFWAGDHVWFLSWRGLKPFPPDSQDVIQSFVYAGQNIPPPGGERMRFNLWLTAQPPASGAGSEVVVQSFRYCPLNVYPVGNPGDLTSIKVMATPSAVGPGDRLTVGFTARNPGFPFVADFYLGAVVPGGTLCFFTGLSPVRAACLPANADPRAFPPLAASVLVSGGLDVTLPELFTYTVDGREPRGDYLLFGVLTPPGAFADGHVDDCELLFVSPTSLTFRP
jgi:hypothetical protein